VLKKRARRGNGLANFGKTSEPGASIKYPGGRWERLKKGKKNIKNGKKRPTGHSGETVRLCRTLENLRFPGAGPGTQKRKSGVGGFGFGFEEAERAGREKSLHVGSMTRRTKNKRGKTWGGKQGR